LSIKRSTASEVTPPRANASLKALYLWLASSCELSQ
jgi:hypothetical protein